jgi:hypothetical protein
MQSDYKTFKFPVIDQGQKYIAGFYDDETMVFDKDLPVILKRWRPYENN